MTIIENGPFRIQTITRLVVEAGQVSAVNLPVKEGLAIEYNVNYYTYEGATPNYIVITMIKYKDDEIAREAIETRDLDYVDTEHYGLYVNLVRAAMNLVEVANLSQDEIV